MKFIKSAVSAKDYPKIGLPEIAFAGRSNAGKSSLINLLAQTKIARTSQSPGKTRLLNFFSVGEAYILVDMPGYGYSTRSGEEQMSWQEMIENYITSRGNLSGLVLVVDIRRKWSEDEELLKDFLSSIGKPMVIALMKADKLSKNEIIKAVNEIKKASGMSAVFTISSVKKLGHVEFEEFLFQNWVKSK